MSPKPQEMPADRSTESRATFDGETVVISGMSGLYPQSSSVKELSDILYNKINPINPDNTRWNYNHPEVSQYTGIVPNVESFDAQFFKVHARLANNMDPMARKILEQTYQAIYDAGLSPEQLSGKKVGVFVGTCFSESEKAFFYASSISGFGIVGSSKSMFANRISYWLNAKGPSMSIDEACCSSTAAVEQAYLAISRGDCEAAVVGGAYLSLHPQSSLHLARIITLCKDGKTKSFDQNADGCAKSEAINVLFLQKAKDALRIYANVVHVKSEYTSLLQTETGPRYGFYRDSQITANFLKKFYEEARVSPGAVEYVEACGSAVSEADKAELEAIGEVFNKEREDPLLIGSVMSNIGYNEAASGISAITKVLLGYSKGELAGNLHYDTPRQDVQAVRDGRLRVLTEHTHFGRTYTAINGISVTGVNSHVLLHGHYKPKDLSRYKCDIPRLVTLSARQESGVKKIIEDLKSRPVDPEELALLHNIHKAKISGHMGRGFVILDTQKDQSTVSLCEKTDYFDDTKRPLWFVYSGMGSQWAGMGTQLMRIPIFAAAIERCHQALAPKGINILDIITSTDKSVFDNILHSFVGIAAIQIGLTDILLALGIAPDKIIGHSVGELGCAYADGCLTAEEMILSAYSRGLVSVQTPFIRGSMAAIGLGYQQMFKMCPPEIEVACHNAAESSTISGPADIMREFVGKLTKQGIFAKEVPCSNIAYHSRYIAEAGPGLLKKLKEVIKSPRARSERWLSTSVPQDRWEEPIAKLSSAEYHTNNLLSPVLFEETSVLIPSNAVLVEIAPHGLLQAILKRSLPESCCNIALTRRGHPDNAFLVLEAIGKLYMEGYTPNVEVLYPKIEFPVSTNTPMLSHLTEWVHSENWTLPLYASAHRTMAASCNFVIAVHDEESSYLQGHVIREQTLYPFAAALVAVWDTLAMSLNHPKKQLSVEFRDVHLYAQPVLHDQRQLRLSVSLHRGTGRFEVLEENSKVITGIIVGNKDLLKRSIICYDANSMDIGSEDVYTILKIKDYYYTGDFRSIHSANWSMSEALLLWRDNWVTLLDGMLQLNVLRHNHDGVSVVKHIRKLCIDVGEHHKHFTKLGDETVLKAEISDHDYTTCGGILIEHLKLRDIHIRSEDRISVETLQFVPRFDHKLDFISTLYVYLQIVAENLNENVINIASISTYNNEARIFKEMKNLLNNTPELCVKYEEINVQDIKQDGCKLFSHIDLVIVQHLSMDDNICQLLYKVLKRDTFIVSEEGGSSIRTREIRPSALYRTLSVGGSLQLARWRPRSVPSGGTVVSAFTSSDIPLLTAARSSMQPRGRMLVLAPQPPPSGLIDLIRAWRKEPARNQISLVMTNPNTADRPTETEVDLAFNVWYNKQWGGEYYVPLQEIHRNGTKAVLQMTRVGDIDSLHWTQATQPLGTGVTVTVHYAGINAMDVAKASGLISWKNDCISFGMDFSGISENGERVMGVMCGGACSSEVRAQPELLWPVPAHWTLEDAATVPLPYLNAFYCFIDSKLGTRVANDKERNILIQGGAGALGQAAISIALGLGYEVFTTVSDRAKKQFLLKLFPRLKEENIGCSRDLSFGDMVLSATNGMGCDLVISDVKGELKNVSLRCCGDSGVTYDISQLSNQEDYSFGMVNLFRSRSYVSLDIASVIARWNSEDMKTLHGLVSAGIAGGYVRPLSRVTYAPHDAPRAFRLLAASAHRGRVLLQLHRNPVPATPRFDLKSEEVHLIVCDSTTLGLQLANRLIKRGARKLHLHCVCPPRYLEYKVRSWRKDNVQVNVSSEDLTKDVPVLIGKASQLGALAGIYTFATDFSGTSNSKFESVLTSLDTLSRKLCPSLRYFAVTCLNNTTGTNTCFTRHNDGYPATLLQIKLSETGDVHMNETQANGSLWRGLVDAVERAVHSARPVLLARQLRALAEPLLHQLAKQADIIVPDNCSEDATLENLGMKNEKIQNVSNYLQLYHSIALNEEDIKNLTVARIREIEDTIYPKKIKETKGLSTFYTHVDPDEIKATTEMVFLPTLTCHLMRDDEIDVTQSHLYIVPGLEGLHSRFSYLCERLKLPALVLQPGLDRPNETIQETAQRYTDVLLKRIGFKKQVYILGFEWGIPVALEVAAILESQGSICTIFCIGFAPEELKEVLEEELKEYATEEELATGVLEHMFALMAGVGSECAGVEAAVRGGGSWSEKVEKCVRTLLGRVSHSAQYARALLQAALGRLEQARRYSSTMQPLRSKLVLLRPARSSRPSLSSPETLSALTEGEVSVHQLYAPLAHAARDARCAAIINAHLHPDILHAFNDNNHCDTYLVNPNVFMTKCDLNNKNIV